MGNGDDRRDPAAIADSPPEELSQKELMLAIGAYAERKGEAEALHEHISDCAERRRSGLLPTLRSVVKSASARLSRRHVESREAAVEEKVEECSDDFDEYLAEASDRFDRSLDPEDDPGFW
jgi:hypothetical protein